MPANTTGTPNTDSYNLGRGKLYISELDTSGKPLAYRDLGNCPEFNLTTEVDSLEHESSMTGLKVVDKDIILKQALKVSFRLEELSDENMALFLSGTSHTGAAPIGHTASVTDVQFCADGNIAKGRWYDIVASNGDRVYGIETIVVKTTQTVNITLVEGYDYVMDREFGRVFLLSTGTNVNAAISANKGLKATLSAASVATTLDVTEVRTLLRSTVRVALKFVAENAVNGARTEYQFHKMNIRANGDEAMISDDWTNMPFEGTAEQNKAADLDSPTLTIRSVSSEIRPQAISAVLNTSLNTLAITFNVPMLLAGAGSGTNYSGDFAISVDGGFGTYDIWDVSTGAYTVSGNVITFAVSTSGFTGLGAPGTVATYTRNAGHWIWTAERKVIPNFVVAMTVV